MSRDRIFFEAFETELEKDAKAKGFLNVIKNLFGQGKKAVTPWLTKGRQAAAKSAPALWLARQPRWVQRFAGFGGKTMAAGAAMTAGELPFSRRRKVVQILPQDEMMGGYR